MKLPYDIIAAKVPHLLRIAAVFSLLGLALMMWSMFDPRPGPVLIGLSLGQLIGTTSFAIYLSIVIWDIRRRRRETSTPEDRASLSKLR
jgi:peptidoglycan/LPS O-acetylase OafA/YrhL